VLIVTALILLAPLEQPVHAYLDPGTGSVIIQALLAAIVAALTFGRTYWSRFKNAVLGRRSKQDDAR
jgi:hypothetical protein